MPPSVPIMSSGAETTGRSIIPSATNRAATNTNTTAGRVKAGTSSQTKRKTTRRRTNTGATLTSPRTDIHRGSSSGGARYEDAQGADTTESSAEKETSLYSSNAAAAATSSSMIGGGMMPYSGMYASPYYGGMPPMMGGGGPFSGVYQVLFGVQNVVFSVTQAVQLMGTNQHALHQAFDSLTGMIDHAIATFHELRALEANESAKETEEQKRRRRRLKALRWAFVMGTSWLLAKIIRRLTTSRRRRIGYDSSNNAGAIGRGMMPYSGYGSSSNLGFGSMYSGGLGPGSSGGGMFGGGGQFGGYYGSGGGYV
mmetsp:Transcript_89561/g.249113  ORF Transcript_89561/g.249113 Transcript_89561/m.249113 type:complete len:311 (+) Transcript_89561:92-1024(+)